MDFKGTLCHYTTAEAAFAYIVPSGALRMSPYARMRDPQENRDLSFVMGGTSDDGWMNEMSAFQRSIKNIRDAQRLLSFTVDASEGYGPSDEPFGRAWARARLWEQYASNHSGVCLVFDRDEAIGTINAYLHQKGSPTKGEVHYSPRGFNDTPAASVDLEVFIDGDHSEQVAQFVQKHERELFFTKTLDWQSEHEYRFMLFTGKRHNGSDDDYEYVPYGSALKAIILGERFPEWQISAVCHACEPSGIAVRQVGWHNNMPWPLMVEA